ARIGRAGKQQDRDRAAAGTRSLLDLRHRHGCASGARSYCRHFRHAHSVRCVFRLESTCMKFAEIDLFGVYVAPLSLLLVGSWVVTIALRRVGGYLGLLRQAWHPALFTFAVYIIVLSSWILIVAELG